MGMMTDPPLLFEKAIRTHFSLKRKEILQQAKKNIEDYDLLMVEMRKQKTVKIDSVDGGLRKYSMLLEYE